jgi:hypothetical protein
MNHVLTLKSCRALSELKGKEPLTAQEYEGLAQLAETCPLQGEHFDEVSWLFPLRIPLEPKVRILDEQDHTVSVLVIYNKNICIGLIGDAELESYYIQYPGALIFVVGEISTKSKDGVEYKNIRPRGWMLFPIKLQEKSSETIENSNIKERKKKKE